MAEVAKKQCSARVWDSRSNYNYTCHHSAVVERDGKWFCKIHDPKYIEEKRAKEQAELDAKLERLRRERHLVEARSRATEGLTLEELRLVTPQLIRDRILEVKGER